MATNSRFIKTFLSVVLSIFFLLSDGCNKNETGPEPTPPEIPPVSTFKIDFGEFPTSPSPAYSVNVGNTPPGVLTTQNWGWAAFNVGVWNTFITVGLIVPVAAFVESFKHEPVQQQNGTWIWSYNFTALGKMHTAKLHGTLTANGTEWEMHISQEGSYSDFKWYYGESNLNLTRGSWVLNNNPDDPDSLVLIEWNRDPATSTADVKYTNVVPNGPEHGGYIKYGTIASDSYDAFYDIYNKGQDNLTEIKWNRTTKDGRVKDTKHFGDAEWHCWDTNLQDIDCP